MAWAGSCRRLLAISAADNTCSTLVETTSSGANASSPSPDVSRATAAAWSPDGAKVGAAYSVTEGGRTLFKVATAAARLAS